MPRKNALKSNSLMTSGTASRTHFSSMAPYRPTPEQCGLWAASTQSSKDITSWSGLLTRKDLLVSTSDGLDCGMRTRSRHYMMASWSDTFKKRNSAGHERVSKSCRILDKRDLFGHDLPQRIYQCLSILRASERHMVNLWKLPQPVLR
jgi:hypothetical protein